MNWLSEKYPDTFDKYYRPMFERYTQLEKKGKRYYSETLPLICQTCQIPLGFTDVEAGNPHVFSHRTSKYNGENFHFCSDGCKHIFDEQPEKYVQAWLPPNQIFQGNCGGATIPEVLQWYKIEHGVDNLDYVGSPDEKMWNKLKNN
jgi:phenol hydroxylase P3 protein